MKKLQKLGLLTLGLFMPLTLTVNAVQLNTIACGTPQQTGEGTARSYLMLDDRGQVPELGVILSKSALRGLPSEAIEINLALPDQAIHVTPFTHIGLNWNTQKHPPIPNYVAPDGTVPGGGY